MPAGSSCGATLMSPFAAALQQHWEEEEASQVLVAAAAQQAEAGEERTAAQSHQLGLCAGAAQLEVTHMASPFSAMAGKGWDEDLASPLAVAAIADSGQVVSLVVAAGQPGCGDQGCQLAQSESRRHTAPWWGLRLMRMLGRQRSRPERCTGHRRSAVQG